MDSRLAVWVQEEDGGGGGMDAAPAVAVDPWASVPKELMRLG